MGGCAPTSLVRFLSAVLCLKRVCFVFEVCVGVVTGVCEAMEAASARPGSAPASKPPAKRLGKHRASRPSGGGILEEKYLTLSVFRSKKCHLEFRNASTIEKNKVYRVGLKPISGPRLCCKDARSSILSSGRALGAEL